MEWHNRDVRQSGAGYNAGNTSNTYRWSGTTPGQDNGGSVPVRVNHRLHARDLPDQPVTDAILQWSGPIVYGSDNKDYRDRSDSDNKVWSPSVMSSATHGYPLPHLVSAGCISSADPKFQSCSSPANANRSIVHRSLQGKTLFFC